MSNTQNNTQVPAAKRLSPELAEVLHMLKSLESQTVRVPAGAVVR